MKIPTSIAELISEFSGLNRTPAFKPVTNCPGNSSSGRSSPTGQGGPEASHYHGNRRQSTVITVGVVSFLIKNLDSVRLF